MHIRRTVAVLWILLVLVAAVPTAAQQPQLSYLEGHQEAVRDVAITADGRLVVSVGVDGTLRVWDRASGQLLRTLAAHERPILNLALSPDGDAVAVGSVDGRVKLLDLPRPYPTAELDGFPSAPNFLSVTDDGQRLVTADGSEVLRLFDLAKKQQVREWGGATGGVLSIGILESKRVLASSGDGVLRGWNLEDGQPAGTIALPSPSQLAVVSGTKTVALAGQDGVLRLESWPPAPPLVLATHADQVTSVALTPDGKSALSGSLDQQVLLFAEGMQPKPLAGAGGRVLSVALTRDGSLAVAGTENGLVKLWKTSDSASVGTLAVQGGAVTSVAFHPQNTLLATASADGSVRVWRNSAAPLALSGHAQPAAVLHVSKDGRRALSAGPDRSVRIWSVADSKSESVWDNLSQPVTAAAFTSDDSGALLGDAAGNLTLRQIDGQIAWTMSAHAGPIADMTLLAGGKLATTAADGQVKVWQLSAIASPRKVALADTASTILPLADGKTILAGGTSGDVTFLELDGKSAPKQAGRLSAPITALSSNADRSRMLVGDASGKVAVIETAKRSLQAKFTAHAGRVRAIAVHPKQPQFATAGEDGSIRLWNVPEPPQELTLHKGPAQVVTVSPDGKQAASGDVSGMVRRWNLPKGTDAGVLPGGTEPIRAAVYRRDGQQLATGDAAGIIRLFQAADGAQQGALGAHDGAVTGLSFHPNHTQLLSSGADGMLRLWQLPLVPPREISKGAAPVQAIAVTSDGNTAVMGSSDKMLRITDLASGKERAALPDVGAVTAIAASPDNTQAAFVTETGTLGLVTLADGKVFAEVGAHLGSASAVAFRPQGGQIATAGSDGQVRLWEMLTVPRAFGDGGERITAAAVSPNGQWLATASADKTVRIWNLADGTASWTLGHAEAVRAIAWKPDSTQIAAAAGKIVQVWNTADGQPAVQLDKNVEGVAALAFAPDGASIYTAGASKKIEQWKLADATLVRSLGEHDKPIISIALAASGVLVSASQDGAIRAWNTATGAPIHTISHDGAPSAVAATSDGKWLAIAGPDKAIKLYDLADGTLAQTIGGLAAAPSCLAFSGDQQTLAGGSADGTVRIWNLQGQLQEFIPSGDSRPTALAFLPDHRQIVVAGETVRIHRRALVRALGAAETPLTAVAWSADGQFILAAADDKTLKLYSAADGNLARQYSGQADVPRCVMITKDGTKVIAGCDDKSLRVWNYSDGSLLSTLLLKSRPRAIAASANGGRIAVAEEKQLRVWDLAAQRASERFDLAAAALAMLADGKSLLAGDAAGVTQRLTLANIAVVAAHPGAIAGAAISADGQKWFSAGRDKTVKAWDSTGKPIAPMGSCEGVPTALALRPDGQQLAVAGNDRHIYLWRLDNNQLERKLSAGSAVISLVYHPSQPKLAAACSDGRLRVFNPINGTLLETVHASSPAFCAAFAGDRLLAGHDDHAVRIHSLSLQRILSGHQGAVNCLAYSLDGGAIYSGGADKTVRQWNSADGAAVRSVATAGDAITGLAVSADGSRLFAASADKTIRVHNAADGAAVATLTSAAPIRLLAVDANGTRLATSGDDGLISVWDAKTGVLRETLPGKDVTEGLAFSNDGNEVLAATRDKSVVVWPLACTSMFAADPTKVHDLAATPDGKHLVTSGDDKLVKLWDPAGNLVRSFSGAAIRSVAVRPDGEQIVAGGDPGQSQPQLMAWNLADGQLQWSVSVGAAIARVAYLDSERIVVACTDLKVRVVRASDGKPVEEIALPAAATAIASVADSEFLAAAADNQVYRLRPALLFTIAAHEGGASAIAWSPSGTEFLSAGADKLVRQWDATFGKPVRTLAGSTAAVAGLAVSGDSKRIVAGCADQRVVLWDLTAAGTAMELQPTSTIPQPTVIRSVACTADGRRIITGDEDGLVRVWDAVSGKEVERLPGHVGPVLSVALSGDGAIGASGGADKTVRRFGMSVDRMAIAAEGPATAMAMSPDGGLVFLASAPGKIRSYSTTDLARVCDYSGAAGLIRALAASSHEGLLAAGGDDTHLRLWSLTDGQLLVDVTTHAPITAVQFARQGRLVVVAGSDGILKQYELSRQGGKLAAMLVLQTRGHVGAVRRLVMGADDRSAFSIAADAKVLKWHIADSPPRWSRELGKQPIHALVFRPDGNALIAAGAEGQLHALVPDDGATSQQWKAHDGGVLGAAFRFDGQELATVGRDGALRIWNPEGKELAKIISGAGGPWHAVAWSPDGSLLGLGGRGKLWQTFQRASQQPVREAQGHNHTILALRYSASGQRVATLDDSGKLFVWDASSGNPLFHQQLSVAAAYRLAWSPDASEIAIASSDPRVIRVLIPPTAR